MKKHGEKNRRKKPNLFEGVRFLGFDFDGTLVKDTPQVFAAFFGLHVSAVFAISFSAAEHFAKSTMGLPTKTQLQHLLNLLEVTDQEAESLQRLAEKIDTDFFNWAVELFPEIIDVLTKLKQQGIGLFISSSRPTKNLEKILQNIPELTQVIDFFIGTDTSDPTLQKGEAHIQKVADHFNVSVEELKRHMLYIGDTDKDIEMAKNEKIRVAGRIGTKTEEELLNSGADTTFTDFSSLPFLFGFNK